MNARLSWLLSISLFLSLSAFSNSTSSREMSLIETDEHLSDRCSYIYDEWQCERTRGCYWNDRRNYCASDYDDGGGHRTCNDIYSPLECSNRSDCYWSTSQQRCVRTGGGGGGGGGGSRRCYYIRSPYECDNTYNCHWSRAYDRCVGPDDI